MTLRTWRLHRATRPWIVSAAALAFGCGSNAEQTPSPMQMPDDSLPAFEVPNEAAPAVTPPIEAPSVDPASEMDGRIDFGVSDQPTTEVEVVCAAQSAASELRRVELAFVFDVSGSMGDNETRFSLKWLPVVAASEAFFSEPDGAAISASMTFVPTALAAERCMDAPYLTPDVPSQPLPSMAFTQAIQALAMTPTAMWRTSTPTLHAFNGVAASLHAAAVDPGTLTQAIVLVTDGVPQNCTAEANDIQVVADAVRASGIRTYVVGVGNPPGAGPADNLSNLHLIAAAGGTEQAFVVETGDPAKTEADFRTVIEGIRGIAVACNMEIPIPPAGTAFLPEKVNVIYGSGESGEQTLNYDPDCLDLAGWHYDDPVDPKTIVLCETSCTTVQRDATARLNVEFGCERRGTPR